MSRCLFCLVAMLLVTTGMASAETVTGIVTNIDGNPINEVNIVIDGVNFPPTDENGEYSITSPNLEGKQITFSHVGYKSIMRKVEVGRPMNITLERSVYRAEGVTVHASRTGDANKARAHTNFTKDDIERNYLVSDFPLLLETTPNLFAYADAGGGLGYSYTKIRGFDDKRISVYINGIPLNDPEDHATYFADLPDFSAEVTDIQIERGVGSSLYGDASFGGSINIVSAGIDRKEKVTVSTGYGSYLENSRIIGDIRKQAVEYSSGLIDGRWNLAGRYSRLWSDGYRKGSWYGATSYFFSLSRLDPKMVSTLNIYGGPMQMHLAYYATDSETYTRDRRYNPLEYGNETDNFSQPHYEFHNTYQINENATLSNTLYYIRGRGFWEQFRTGRKYEDYNLPGDYGDLVRQQWIVKNQYGFNPRLDIKHESGEFLLGGAFYLFDSDHWGQVVWAEGLSRDDVSPQHKYYQYFGNKFSGSMFVGENRHVSERLDVSLNLQARYIRQSLDQTMMGAFVTDNDYTLDWLLLSPRTAITYDLSDEITLSTSFAVSSRIPADYSIYDANEPSAVPNLDIKTERVYDIELGGSYRNRISRVGLNLYWMEFRNEIVPWGGLDDSGYPITTNAERSVHAGIEVDASVTPVDWLACSGNFSVTYNRAKDFRITQTVYDNSDTWNPVGSITIDNSDFALTGFPTYLGNLLADMRYDRYRFVARSRVVGRQYIDSRNSESISIDPYVTFSLSASATVTNPFGFGDFVVNGRVDNVFNEKYEASGYSETYYFRDEPDATYAYYIPAAERSFFVELQLQLD